MLMGESSMQGQFAVLSQIYYVYDVGFSHKLRQ